MIEKITHFDLKREEILKKIEKWRQEQKENLDRFNSITSDLYKLILECNNEIYKINKFKQLADCDRFLDKLFIFYDYLIELYYDYIELLIKKDSYENIYARMVFYINQINKFIENLKQKSKNCISKSEAFNKSKAKLYFKMGLFLQVHDEEKAKICFHESWKIEKKFPSLNENDKVFLLSVLLKYFSGDENTYNEVKTELLGSNTTNYRKIIFFSYIGEKSLEEKKFDLAIRKYKKALELSKKEPKSRYIFLEIKIVDIYLQIFEKEKFQENKHEEMLNEILAYYENVSLENPKDLIEIFNLGMFDEIFKNLQEISFIFIYKMILKKCFSSLVNQKKMLKIYEIYKKYYEILIPIENENKRGLRICIPLNYVDEVIVYLKSSIEKLKKSKKTSDQLYKEFIREKQRKLADLNLSESPKHVFQLNKETPIIKERKCIKKSKCQVSLTLEEKNAKKLYDKADALISQVKELSESPCEVIKRLEEGLFAANKAMSFLKRVSRDNKSIFLKNLFYLLDFTISHTYEILSDKSKEFEENYQRSVQDRDKVRRLMGEERWRNNDNKKSYFTLEREFYRKELLPGLLRITEKFEKGKKDFHENNLEMKNKFPAIARAFESLPDKIHSFLKEYDAYLIGGAPRDFFLRKKPNDLDFITHVTLNEIKKFFPNGDVYSSINLYRVSYQNWTLDIHYEMTTSMSDFTINSLLVDSNGVVTDPTGNGLSDLKEKIIRLAQPLDNLKKDTLLILRLAYVSEKFPGFKIEAQLKAYIINNNHRFQDISLPIFHSHLSKLFLKGNAASMYERWKELKLWNSFCRPAMNDNIYQRWLLKKMEALDRLYSNQRNGLIDNLFAYFMVGWRIEDEALFKKNRSDFIEKYPYIDGERINILLDLARQFYLDYKKEADSNGVNFWAPQLVTNTESSEGRKTPQLH